MKYKTYALLILTAVSTLVPQATFAHGGGSSGSGRGGDDRVRVEVRAGEEEPEENRVRVEVRGNANVEDAIDLVNKLNIPDDVNRIRVEARGDQDRVRVELRGQEKEEALQNIEIKGNTFEITGKVTTFTEGAVTIDGQIITIDPSKVENFEQEGTIEVGEAIKIEGIIQNGTLFAREIKANGLEQEAKAAEENSLRELLNKILTFLNQVLQR